MADASSAEAVRQALPEDEEEEEEETCGFCIFMKAGGCKPEFNSWEKCVDQARQTEQDFTEGCRDQTQALQQCMLDNKEYYAPLLEGQSTPLDAAEESSEDHSEASALTDMAAGDSKQDEPASSKHLDDESQASPEKQQSNDSHSESANAVESKRKSDDRDDAAENSKDSSAGQKSQPEQDADAGKEPETSSQPQQGSSGGDDRQQKEEAGGDEEPSGSGEPFNLPHPGTEDKTGMPGEPEPVFDVIWLYVPSMHWGTSRENQEIVLCIIDLSQEPEEEEGGEGAAEEEEEDPAPPEVKVQSAPFDVRFPGTNQARHCYARYNEYHKCAKDNGDDDERCNVFQRAYRSICPGEWVERWNEQRESGTWPGRW